MPRPAVQGGSPVGVTTAVSGKHPPSTELGLVREKPTPAGRKTATAAVRPAWLGKCSTSSSRGAAPGRVAGTGPRRGPRSAQIVEVAHQNAGACRAQTEENGTNRGSAAATSPPGGAMMGFIESSAHNHRCSVSAEFRVANSAPRLLGHGPLVRESLHAGHPCLCR